MAFMVAATLLLPGCAGLEKMKKNASLIRYKVTPEILETHGGNVEIAVNGMYPPLYFHKKAVLVTTPVLKYEGGETPLPAVTVQGEKVRDNYKVITYNAGGNFAYKENLAYNAAMHKSDLVMKVKAKQGKKSIDFDDIPIAKGILATSTLMDNQPKPVLGIRREANSTGKYDPAIDPFQRIVPDEMIADILYLINSSKLRSEEVKSADVQGLLEYTKEADQNQRKNLKKVEVSAYASPDGSLDLNIDLASEREKVSTSFVENELKKAKVETNLRTRYTPEDWEGFKDMLEQSNIQDKDLILRVLSMYNDPEVREREIKNLSSAFTQIADEVLPRLRRAKLLTSVDIIGKTDEEIIAIAESKPGSLNQAELLYAATLTDNPDKKLNIYNLFSKQFPNDWRGPNNTGLILTQQKKIEEARGMFEKAEKLRNDEPIVKNNLGVIALIGNDIKKAEEYFGAASGSGNEVNYNLGLVSIKKGDYIKAIQYFRNFADPNTALAKILLGNYNGALSDLEEYEGSDSYLKEYLKAIIGARTGNESLLFDSLKKAVALNGDLKKTAANDLEFAKYADNSKFISAVQ